MNNFNNFVLNIRPHTLTANYKCVCVCVVDTKHDYISFSLTDSEESLMSAYNPYNQMAVSYLCLEATYHLYFMPPVLIVNVV